MTIYSFHDLLKGLQGITPLQKKLVDYNFSRSGFRFKDYFLCSTLLCYKGFGFYLSAIIIFRHYTENTFSGVKCSKILN